MSATPLGPAAPLSRPLRLRTLLYTPADRPERYTKAWREGAADMVAADLEDAVAPEGKAAARAQAAQALRAVPRAPALRAVRINAWPNPLAQEDLAAVVPARPDAIVVPKCESPESVRQLERRVADLERQHGVEAGHVRLVLILETAQGLLEGAALCKATPRVMAVCFGAEDLAADVGLRRTPGNAEVAALRALVPVYAAAAGVAAIDMITADVQDLERCRREAAEARGLGYRGKMCIHPAQAKAVHDALRPGPDEVAWAHKVVAAADAGGATQGGVVVVDGRMVDVPVVRQARRILADF